MRIHIEDLEAIKEMNDEMEEGHVETEKHLQETIGGFQSMISVVAQVRLTSIRHKTPSLSNYVSNVIEKRISRH